MTTSTDPPQWNGAVKLLPLWLAPNMVTLLGFMFILANVALLEVYIPDLASPVRLPCSSPFPSRVESDIAKAPSWVYFSFAFGLWMYVWCVEDEERYADGECAGTPQWTTLMASKREGLANLADWGSCSSR